MLIFPNSSLFIMLADLVTTLCQDVPIYFKSVSSKTFYFQYLVIKLLNGSLDHRAFDEDAGVVKGALKCSIYIPGLKQEFFMKFLKTLPSLMVLFAASYVALESSVIVFLLEHFTSKACAAIYINIPQRNHIENLALLK